MKFVPNTLFLSLHFTENSFGFSWTPIKYVPVLWHGS